MSLGYTGGPWSPPGDYTIRVTIDSQVVESTLKLKRDPRWEVSDQDLLDQYALTMDILEKVNQSHQAIEQLRSIREQVVATADRAVNAGHSQSIKDQATQLAAKLTEVENELIQTQNQSGQDPINYPPKLDNQLVYLYTVVNSQDARPTEGSYQRFEDLKKEMKTQLDILDKVMKQDLSQFKELLKKEGVGAIIIPEKD